MKLIIEKTKGFKNPHSILHDLAIYHDIEKWIDDVYKRKTNFIPEQFFVFIGVRCYELISEELSQEETDHNYKKLKENLNQLPKEFKQFPNDYILIEADEEDKKLIFDLDGCW